MMGEIVVFRIYGQNKKKQIEFVSGENSITPTKKKPKCFDLGY
jgi:hypothetical protein